MRLSARDLNRNLLARQHLLTRSPATTHDAVAHLVGLQAQDNLPPYLSLAARLTGFAPHSVSAGLEDGSLVRLLTLRGTIHLLTADDALSLRQWTQPVQERERRASATVRPALHVDSAAFDAAVREALADGPLPGRELGVRLAGRFPEVPPTALTNLARVTQPLAQLPPRGCWRKSGGVVYQRVDDWLGRPLREPDPTAIVRRYLRAFGPATAADVTAWSGVTRLGPVLTSMTDLVTHADETGRTLYDVPDGPPLVSGEVPAPVRLLGTYDNVWLSHAGRDRVTTRESRKRWMGPNGGSANTILVDGMLEGLWRAEGGRVVPELFGSLSRDQRAQLDTEVARTEELLRR